MVTAAHCTYLCKNDDDVVENCCCDNVSGLKCANTTSCGSNPRVVEMTGNDVEVVCGEWEIGNTPFSTSGEKYNSIFRIQVNYIDI